MSSEPRKASDLLLDLESKVDILLSIVRSQDLNIKILSNKLNSVLEKVQQTNSVAAPQYNVEAVNTQIPIHSLFSTEESDNKQIAVSAEDKLPLEENPKGFRRTSRPETYSGDQSYLPAKKEAKPAEVVVQAKKPQPPPQAVQETVPNKKFTSGSVPVQQRTVDKNGKSIFLADIDIVSADTGEPIYKTRTNGAGKWFASLPVGKYKITLRKKESLSKDKSSLEAVQEILVDGNSSPLELPMIIVK